MQVIIEISDEYYKAITEIPNHQCTADMLIIKNGIPLSKGHGDLVDRGEISDRFYAIWNELEYYSNQPTYKELLDKLSMCLDTALPIIETDAESEE